MGSRRKMLIVGAVILFAVVFIAAGVMLVRGFMAFYRAESALRDSKARLEYLYARNPFPSDKNLAVERANLETLRQQLGGLLDAMAKGEVATVEQSPAKFVTQFWEIQKAMLDAANEAGVTVGGKKDFGFERHMGGQLPAPKDVARLTQQLCIVQLLCSELYAARITELRGIGREEFEEEALATGAGRSGDEPTTRRSRSARPDASASALNSVNAGAGIVPEGQMFGKWHFVLSFTAREGALLQVMDRLAKSPLFTVIDKVELVGDNNVSAQSAAKATAAEGRPQDSAEKPAGAILSRDERIVAGRDIPLAVRMEVDVYQFAKPAGAPAPAAEGAQ